MTPHDLMPHNLEAEESVLGAMLMADRACDTAGQVLQAGDFYRRTHGTIFQTILALHQAGQAHDSLAVTDALLVQGQLEKVGGRAAVHTLASTVPAVSNTRSYAEIVLRHARDRQVAQAAGAVRESAMNGGVSEMERDQLRQVLDQTERQAKTRRYLRSTGELRARPPVDYLLPPVLAERRMIVTFGPSDTFKSFIILAWVLTVAAGLPWGDEESKQGPVVYIAAEGADGVIRRAEAWCAISDVADIPDGMVWGRRTGAAKRAGRAG